MMDNIRETLNNVEHYMKQGVKYPEQLLVNHNPDFPEDREYLRYLTGGGAAGGYYHWLTLICQHSDARLIVELGTRYGSSTIALFAGLRTDQTLISVDIERNQKYVPELIRSDPRINFVQGDCLTISNYYTQLGYIPINIDILFTDTIHTYDQIVSEFYVYSPLLADQAVIAIDDINLNDKGKFFDEWKGEKYDLTQICHISGFGVLHYQRPDEEKGLAHTDRIIASLIRSGESMKKKLDQISQSISPGQELGNLKLIHRKVPGKMRSLIKRILR